MDINRYTKVGVVSPAEGQIQPEILADAKMGHVDKDSVSDKTQQKIFAFLDGKSPSSDPQGEAYRLLIIAVCADWHRVMPFLFEKLDDYTELLLPDDLLSGGSILADVREAMTREVCANVEVIGWLYQFYISEKKDKVFEDLKKNKKITPENIPAATQLFTPRWIVRYVVENSLGRLWMLNRPSSKLIDQMDFYSKLEPSETDFVRIAKPEDLKICDPACGSGHMLVYAFDLLYAIYEEEGYDATEIPRLILENNLFGIEIDERAGELAAFALAMKAREKHRRFFSNPVQPQICILENVAFAKSELEMYIAAFGNDHFSTSLQDTLNQFTESKTVGSLIRPASVDTAHILNLPENRKIADNLFLHKTHDLCVKVVRYIDFLSPKYHVVIANPPYMGSKGMNPQLRMYLEQNFGDVKSDLYSAFISRIISMVQPGGFIGMMTPFTWMFLSSFEALRNKVLGQCTIQALVRPEYHAFFESAYVPICAFTLFAKKFPSQKGIFVDLNRFYGADVQDQKLLEALHNSDCDWLFRASTEDFQKIPGYPVAYWVSDRIREIFTNSDRLSSVAAPRQGLATGDNGQFVRFWHELSLEAIKLNSQSNTDAKESGKRWFPYNKGGDYRKWYGNQQCVVNWENDGFQIRNFYGDSDRLRSRPQNVEHYFQESLSWSKITSGGFSLRYFPCGFVFDVAGCSIFLKSAEHRTALLAALNSPVMTQAINSLSPTLNFEVGQVADFPIPKRLLEEAASIAEQVNSLIGQSKMDWDSAETSWNFESLLLLDERFKTNKISSSYEKLRSYWRSQVQTMKETEESLSSQILTIYGLDGELDPVVPIEKICLSSNPHYRYGGGKTTEELEKLLLSDTARDLVSYAVGCIFGRYSLDKPGLVIANQSDVIASQVVVTNTSFAPDTDNVVPILDGDWFTDDISDRFRKFVRVTFGDAHYQDNLQFVEAALGKDIRTYFLKDFYQDHLKKYKKRPIYWLFSSPRGTFNALVYIHRYRPDTVSIVLNDYLREFRTKINARKSHQEAVSLSASASPTQKLKADKEIDSLRKSIDELDSWERNVLYPLATQQIKLNLDDGVKTNYMKLGVALKQIPGFDTKED